MSQSSNDIQAIETSTLLTCYGFDLRGFTPLGLINDWLKTYPLQWIRWAVVEALYQGRYKAISVEQLLNFWLRRGQPSFHFNSEFERLISHNLPKNYSANLFTNHPDDQRSLLVPPTMTAPHFPPPPSLLEPILNKPLIQLPDPLEPDLWEEEDLKDEQNEIIVTEETAAIADLPAEIPLSPSDDALEGHDPPLVELNTQETVQNHPTKLEPETVNEVTHDVTKETGTRSSSRSIHRFMPVLDESDLFGKLRTVVHRELTDSLT
ncbi:MAG: hypothetical protein VKJ02_01835 [Snowella sp.]|nr:hypothetical protein [Snowella sp.]